MRRSAVAHWSANSDAIPVAAQAMRLGNRVAVDLELHRIIVTEPRLRVPGPLHLPSSMLQPVAPSESSLFESVASISRTVALLPGPVVLISRMYVVLASSLMPPPDAVKVLSPVLSEFGCVNAPSTWSS